MKLVDQLEALVTALEQRLDQISALVDLEALRVDYLGRKGRLAELMSRLPELAKEERPEFGQVANRVKQRLT